jgi:hypothetical protein
MRLVDLQHARQGFGRKSRKAAQEPLTKLDDRVRALLNKALSAALMEASNKSRRADLGGEAFPARPQTLETSRL